MRRVRDRAEGMRGRVEKAAGHTEALVPRLEAEGGLAHEPRLGQETDPVGATQQPRGSRRHGAQVVPGQPAIQRCLPSRNDCRLNRLIP